MYVHLADVFGLLLIFLICIMGYQIRTLKVKLGCMMNFGKNLNQMVFLLIFALKPMVLICHQANLVNLVVLLMGLQVLPLFPRITMFLDAHIPFIITICFRIEKPLQMGEYRVSDVDKFTWF